MAWHGVSLGGKKFVWQSIIPHLQYIGLRNRADSFLFEQMCPSYLTTSVYLFLSFFLSSKSHQRVPSVALRHITPYLILSRHSSFQNHIYNLYLTYTPSSMPTFLHHGLSAPLSANISSASPTCRRSLTSLLTCPDSFNRIAFMASTLVGRDPYRLVVPRANPWEPDRMSSLCVHPSLMTGNCYWRGSDDEERRLRWR